ncbi:MAG: hypothetical protein H6Q01_24 [Acidobacteria bacterium]|nr:hypothetical protein [Acidobacteriota bacterium]
MIRRRRRPARTLPSLLPCTAVALLLLALLGCGGSEAPPSQDAAGAAAPAPAGATEPATPAPAPADPAPPLGTDAPIPPSRMERPKRAPETAPHAPSPPESASGGAAPAQAGAPNEPAPEPLPPPPPPPPPQIVVAEGTTFSVRIANDLSGKDSKIGQRVKGTLLSNLKGEGGTLPCQGWTIVGTVAEIVPPESKNSRIVGNKTTGRNVGIVAGSAVAGAILGKQLGNKSGKNAAIGGVVGGAAGAVGASQAKGNHARVSKDDELELGLVAELRVPKGDF